MMQNSPAAKRESRNPHQTICEFRKFAAGRGNNEKSRTHPRPRQPHQLSLHRIQPIRPTQNHIQAELTHAITGTPHPSLPVGIFSHGRSG